MLALIMAGGEGSRLNMGEKPLVSVGGRPMIARVIDVFRAAGCEVVVVVSQKTPMTQNWCRVNRIDIIRADGLGFVEDMVSAVTDLEEVFSLFVSVSDIPCLSTDIIAKIRNEYDKSGKDACSTWVPCSLLGNKRNASYIEQVDGVDAFPAGVNILRGDLISETQEELRLLLAEPRLAYNINTRTDLIYADRFFLNH